MKRLALTAWVLLLIFLVYYFFRNNRLEILHLIHIIRHIHVIPLLLMLLFQSLIFILFGVITARILWFQGYKLSIWEGIKIYLTRTAVGSMTPVSGVTSTIAYTELLRQKKIPPEVSLYSLLVKNFLGYVSFIIILLFAIVLLLARHTSFDTLIPAFIVVIVMGCGLAVLLMYVSKTHALPHWLIHRLPQSLQHQLTNLSHVPLRISHYVQLLAFELLIEAAGIVTMYFAAYSTRHPINIESAFLVYTFSTLFILVVPIFSGLGIVEAGSAIILHQLGMHPANALATILIWRVGEFWFPLVLGLALLPPTSVVTRKVIRYLPVVSTLITGSIAIASVISPRLPHSLRAIEGYTLISIPSLSRIFVLLSGFLLIVLSVSLWQRKRVAWFLALTVTSLSVVFHLLKGHDRAGAVISLINAIVLLITRNRFVVKSDIPTMRLGLARFAIILSLTLMYGVAGFFFISAHAFHHNFRFIDAVNQTFMTFFTLNPHLTPYTQYGAWFLNSLGAVGIVSIVYAVYSLIHPVIWRRTTYRHERERAKDLITQYGNSSLDYFKYTADKLFFFSSSGKAVIAYGLAGPICIALDDPNAKSRAEFKKAVEEFLTFADVNSWIVAFHQVAQRYIGVYKSLQLQCVKIGEEAIVDLREFNLSGSHRKSLRASYNRIKKQGYNAVLYPSPQNSQLIDKLEHVSNVWLTLGKHKERGFTLGAFDRKYMRISSIMTVEDKDQNVCAFVNIIPSGVQGQATIDLMRRLDEPQGAMDFLFVNLFFTLRDKGYTSFSLGMAPLSHIGREIPKSQTDKILYETYEHLDAIFSFKGLHEYKQKFNPIWEPLYLVYKSQFDLPRILYGLNKLTQ